MTSQNKKPMPLKDLPQYLESARENGDMEDGPVVEMGQIIMPEERSHNWVGIAAASILFVSVSLGGLIAYDSMSREDFKVIVNTNAPSNMSKIVSDSNGEIISVKQNTNDTYEVHISTRKSKRSFLDWLQNNRNVRNAVLKD